jgi:pilus assembly protein CpaC
MNNFRTMIRRAPLWLGVPVMSLVFLASPALASEAKKTGCISTEVAPLINVPLGKSAVLKLQSPAARIILGNPGGGRAAIPTLVQSDSKAVKGKGEEAQPTASTSSGVADIDVILLNPNEIYLLGKAVGSTNIIVLGRDGVCTTMDIAVGIDTKTLESRLNQFIPGSTIKVTAAADSVLLSGMIADATKVQDAINIAAAYTGSPSRVINMLDVGDPQQVMLEVKVAEVDKTLVDQLGAKFNMPSIHGAWTYSVMSDFLSGAAGSISAVKSDGKAISVDAQKTNNLVKILAEPNIMAISGQEGSFLAGGEIYIPVPQSNTAGGQTITLQQEEYGVSLKVLPTVLSGGRINLRVRPEVSELSPTGATVKGEALSLVLPLITTRKAETTVQLNDGQSFAIGGLIKSNTTQNVDAFPILGELPIIGALFRDSSFQKNRTELVFVITPHLVKPLPPDYPLPTDNISDPSRTDFFLYGKMEGTPPSGSDNKAPASGGFELK